jgi:ABC-2 type transport system permease protein
VLVRVRTPREILQIVVGTAVGVGVAVGPVFATSGGTSSVVLIGASIQLTILITAGNTFGLDGPALASELLAGADGRTMARAKARSTLIVGLPLVAIPVVPAALTGGWFLLPAGVLVAAGALLAGTGGAVAQSAYAPIALPDTDNPFASGDTGRGCLVGVLTFTSLVVQALLAAPVGLLLYLALPDMDAPWVTLLAAAAIPVGWAVLATGTWLAARHVDRHGPDLIVAITPSR